MSTWVLYIYIYISGKPLKLVHWFTNLDSNISSIERDVKKVHTTIDSELIIRKSYLSDKLKQHFFKALGVSVLLHGFTISTLTKCPEKKPVGNYTKMLWAVLNKSWQKHPIKQQLYGHSHPIIQTIELWWIRHTGGTAGEVTKNSYLCWDWPCQIFSDPTWLIIR